MSFIEFIYTVQIYFGELNSEKSGTVDTLNVEVFEKVGGENWNNQKKKQKHVLNTCFCCFLGTIFNAAINFIAALKMVPKCIQVHV